MFLKERQRKILELLEENGRIEVQEICAAFGVSEDSARRDLRLMEQEGLLERTYGGAIPKEGTGFLTPFTERQSLNAAHKEEIAALAASFVRDGDSLYLDGSTTAAKLIPCLRNRSGLTVFTHSVEVAHQLLCSGTGAELYLIGGHVGRGTANACGAQTCEQITSLCCDRVFTAPCGLSASWGLSCTSAQEADVKRALLSAGREVYLLAPGDALGKRALVRYAPLSPSYTVITDSCYDSEYSEFSELTENGLKILTASK